MANKGMHRGIIVTAAGTGINLALGILYTWSIFKSAIRDSIEEGGPGAFQWSPASLNDPYAVTCIVFALMMVVAGRIQDRFGPRITAFTGGLLVAAGFALVSTTSAYSGWVLGFGVLAGTGIAFGYSAATPAALKWFPPTKTGRISGIVVSGFGLASVYIAPLAQYLLDTRGIHGAMLFFGVAFLIVVSLLSLLLKNPPEGYVPSGFEERRTINHLREDPSAKPLNVMARPSEILRTPFFWILWTLYFIGSGAGLMVIGSVAGMAKSSMGANAFLAVAILAVGNAGGRVVAGMLSDSIGRKMTLFMVFGFQALLMFLAIPIMASATINPAVVLGLATLIGFNYGANLSLFPSYTKDMWGMKHFGVNYGALFTAWGVGGLVLGRLSQSLFARSGSYESSFIVAGILLAIGTVVIVLMHDRNEELRRELREKAIREAHA